MLKIGSDVEANLLSKSVGVKALQMQANGTASTNAHLSAKDRNVAVTTTLPSERLLPGLGYTRVNISKIKQLPAYQVSY